MQKPPVNTGQWADMRSSSFGKVYVLYVRFDQNWNGIIVSRKILPYQIHADLFSRSAVILRVYAPDGRADVAIFDALRKDVNALYCRLSSPTASYCRLLSQTASYCQVMKFIILLDWTGSVLVAKTVMCQSWSNC
jgi:hypothetical protein